MIQNPFSNEFPIGRLSGCCAACGQPLQPGQVYYAVIWRQGEEYARKDFDEKCWAAPPADAVGVWRAKVPMPEVKAKARHVPAPLLLSVFERLGDTDGTATQKLRFVLALLLLRRRLLRLSGTAQEAGCEIWRMRRTGEENDVDVVCPPLTQEDADQLSQQLADLLAGLDTADDVAG
jgi:hypothetical protein